MSSKSNDYGRAFEYITIMCLNEAINQVRPTTLQYNSSFYAVKEAWERTDFSTQKSMEHSARAICRAIFDVEPMIAEDDGDKLVIKIQPDQKGEAGDVRDIVLIRQNACWEIGLSLKHNNFAVKHSRLAKNLDFGKKWFGIPCSQEYWEEIAPIFKKLEEMKNSRLNWKSIPNKENDIYLPLLQAFCKEVKRCYRLAPDLPKRLVSYLLGEFDFYKMVSEDSKEQVHICVYNLKGTLNRSSGKAKPKRILGKSKLPERIIELEIKPNSNTTVDLTLDEGWAFSFRIHNASSKVETSLKFDIKTVGIPTTVANIMYSWEFA